jgi:WD40 repeat protein
MNPEVQDIPPAETIACPYPGLRPFRRDEAIVFFGRDEQVDQLLAKLDRSRFLAVVGTSGCGKSSLVRAGLIPALETGLLVSGGARWAVATMRPGDQPMRNLARALLDDGVVTGPAATDEHAPELLAAALRRGPLGLAEAVRDAPPPGQKKLLLLVDQFEEIFRFRREGDRDEADAFVELLLASAAVKDPPIYVVLTMRSDYLGDCSLFEGLPEALNDSQFLTPRLTRNQRREAIEAPAVVFDGRVEPAMVNRLLNAVDVGPDQLPLMQHALMRLWTRARRAAVSGHDESPGSAGLILTLDEYEAIGGLKLALSAHADEMFERLDEGQQAIAEVLFRSLSESGIAGRDVRRPTSLQSVAEVAGVSVERVVRVVEAFRHPDLSILVPALPVPLEPDTILDISHESLIRQWQRLGAWAEAEAASADMYRRLEKTASLWVRNRAGLWDTPDLELAVEWKARERPSAAWAARYGGDFKEAMRFLDASRKEQRRKRAADDQRRAIELESARRLTQAAEERRQIESERAYDAELAAARLRRLVVGLVALAAISVGLAVVAFIQRNQASSARALANTRAKEAEEQAQIALLAGLEAKESARRAEEQAAIATKAKQETEQQFQIAKTASAKATAAQLLAEQQSRIATSQRLAAQSQAIFESQHERGLLLSVEAIKSLQKGDPAVRPAIQSLRDVLSHINRIGFSKARSFAIAEDDKGIRSRVLLSADGRRLVTTGKDGRLRAWDVQNAHSDPIVLGEHRLPMALSDDGRRLVTIEDNFGLTTTRVWDLNDPLADPRVFGEDGLPLALSGDGRRLVTTGKPTQSPRLWNLDDPNASPVVLDHDSSFKPLISVDGRRLVMASFSGTQRMWNLDEPNRAPINLRGFVGSIDVFTLSGDGSHLAGGGRGMVRVWNLDDTQASPISFRRPAGPISILSLSADGQRMACPGDDGLARVWKAADPKAPPLVFRGHVGRVHDAKLSADGRYLATAGEDGTARVWDASDPRTAPLVLRAEEPMTAIAAFCADGRRLVTTGRAGIARVWDLAGSEAEPMVFQKSRGPIRTAALSADGRRLVTAGDDGAARIWDLFEPAADPIVLLHGHKKPIQAVAISADGRHLATGDDMIVRVWQTSDVTAAPLVLRYDNDFGLGTASRALALILSADGRHLAVSCNDATNVRDFSGEASGTGVLTPAISLFPVNRLHAVFARGQAAAMSADGRRLAAIDDAHGAAVFWDLSGVQPRLATLGGHKGPVRAAALSWDGRRLACGNGDGTARVWDTSDPKAAPIVLRGHEGPIRAVAISADGRRLATAGDDATARIWDLDDTKADPLVLRGHEGPIRALALSADGGLLTTAGDDGAARRWNLRTDDLIALAGRIAGRNLTHQEWQQYFPGRPYRKTFADLPEPKD